MSTVKTTAIDLASGTVAGGAQLLCGHPFDTVKLKLQTQPKPLPGELPRYAGAIDAARKTLVEQGLFGLYRGMAAPLATVAAFNALLFSVRGFMESTLAHPDGSPLTVGDQAIAGLGAGFAVSFLACPTELAKCRLQAQFGKKPASGGIQHMADGSILYRGPMDVLGHVVKAEGGPTAIFRGLWPTLLREVPGNAVMFGVYEYLKQKLAAAQVIFMILFFFAFCGLQTRNSDGGLPRSVVDQHTDFTLRRLGGRYKYVLQVFGLCLPLLKQLSR
eukprot:jgi/Botrbrau1/8777/Bobra.0330s0010.2